MPMPVLLVLVRKILSQGSRPQKGDDGAKEEEQNGPDRRSGDAHSQEADHGGTGGGVLVVGHSQSEKQRLETGWAMSAASSSSSKKQKLLKDLDDLFAAAPASAARAVLPPPPTTSVVRKAEQGSRPPAPATLPKKRRAQPSQQREGSQGNRPAQRIYAPLPICVLTPSARADSGDIGRVDLLSRNDTRAKDAVLNDFLSQHIGSIANTNRGRQRLDALLDAKLRGKSLMLSQTSLSKPASAAAPPRRRSQKHLSGKALRRLGLGAVESAKGMSFRDCGELHRLWLQYVEQVVGKSAGGMKSMEKRLSGIDVQGAFIQVLACGVESLTGVRGIIVEDCPSVWLLMCVDDKLRRVPKECSQLACAVHGRFVTLDARSGMGVAASGI
jgi:hypothetical protein